ncbi:MULTISPECIES: hypothetical protein [unclassified Rathayibacter]|uniref:hypothetical protein n=1 Tax=unclassified Rathayibacter TaxID=2609250 RepID=UPI000F4CBD05|nr:MULTISPECIES: hypothetical protein [unclassified Rathayibacter]ROP49259.1 hypothetical protein EDF45_2591 [Rathayibacter sp. PhB186]ROS50624.1 hypothetical protein EDF44_2457 [Rathayibacter sp. PhB185]TCL83203.1 hypothetical protein EDF49_104256 [Rathayibacter sp. PhB192]TCM28701.1 hypothetical protein EDF43_104257 [Rathayibacter sp. PhB179]
MKLVRTTTIGVIAAALLGLASAPPATAAGDTGGTATDPTLCTTNHSVYQVDTTVNAHLDGQDVVIDLSAGLFRTRTRIVVLVNDEYIGETYCGSAYYADRWSVGDRVFLRMKPARPGDALRVAVIGGTPGGSLGSRYGQYSLLEERLSAPGSER